jgi:hypothetical protein
MNGAAISPALRLWRIVSIVDLPAFLVGGLAAVAGQRWGAYLLITNLVVQIGSHLMVGGWAYREVMTRPWPKVAPLSDEDGFLLAPPTTTFVWSRRETPLALR